MLRVSRLPACRQQWVLTALPTPSTFANRVRACSESNARRHHRFEIIPNNQKGVPFRRWENTQLASTQSRSPLPHLNHQADQLGTGTSLPAATGDSCISHVLHLVDDVGEDISRSPAHPDTITPPGAIALKHSHRPRMISPYKHRKSGYRTGQGFPQHEQECSRPFRPNVFDSTT